MFTQAIIFHLLKQFNELDIFAILGTNISQVGPQRMFLKILVLPTAMSYLCWQKLREMMRQTDALGKDWLEGGRFDGWLVPFSCREVAHYPSFSSFYTPDAVGVNMKHSDLLSNVAKCNLGTVNLELMLQAVSPSLHMICGSAPWGSHGQPTYSLAL